MHVVLAPSALDSSCINPQGLSCTRGQPTRKRKYYSKMMHHRLRPRRDPRNALQTASLWWGVAFNTTEEYCFMPMISRLKKTQHISVTDGCGAFRKEFATCFHKHPCLLSEHHSSLPHERVVSVLEQQVLTLLGNHGWGLRLPGTSICKVPSFLAAKRIYI